MKNKRIKIIIVPTQSEIKNVAYPTPSPMGAWQRFTRFIASFFNI